MKQFRRSQPFLYSIVMTLFVIACMLVLGAFIMWCANHTWVTVVCFGTLAVWLFVYNIILDMNINDDKRDDNP